MPLSFHKYKVKEADFLEKQTNLMQQDFYNQMRGRSSRR